MLTVSCGKCGVALRVDTSKLNPASPLVKCPKCGGVNRIKLPETSSVSAPSANEVWGWLVVHDEAAASKTFDLRLGKQVIGRISFSNPADIMIETADKYMSRSHCVIEVSLSKTGTPAFVLSDPGSANGTFLNENADSRLSPYDQVYLNDGDVIQIGRTQVVLKTRKLADNQQAAEKAVANNDYLKTIIL